MSDNSSQAVELYAQGMSVSGVAKKLGISWYTASKMRPTLTTPEEEAEDDGEAEEWDVTLTIPTEKADSIFATFEPQEKFNAIQFVLQARMDAALEGA